MSDLYEQRIDAMKARERKSPLYSEYGAWAKEYFDQPRRNIARLAAYKRKRDLYGRTRQ